MSQPLICIDGDIGNWDIVIAAKVAEYLDIIIGH